MRGGRGYRPYGGRRRSPWLTVLLALLGLGLAFCLTLEAVVLVNGRDRVQGRPAAMVVLGCQVRQDGPSILLRDRLDKALAYWEEHPEIIVVVSGGQGKNEPVTEAAAMAEYLVERGVPQEQVLLEQDSHNSNQNIRYSVRLLREHGIDPARDGVVVVSNFFHIARVRLLWNRVCGGTETLSVLAAPCSHFSAGVYSSLREVPGLVKSFVFDRQ